MKLDGVINPIMTALKYYDEERKALPKKILNGVLLEKDVATQLRRVCQYFGVPEIAWEMWDKNYSCYNPVGYDKAPSSFRFSRRTYIAKREAVSFIWVHHFLHELAHYLDECQRTLDIEELFRNDIQAFVYQSMKIRNAKWHGPRHRAQMVLLIQWWLSQGSK